MRTLHRMLLAAALPALGCCDLPHLGGGCMGGHEHGSRVQPETPPDGAEAQPPAAVDGFACSMHPEVRATFPGTCPVCRMALEKQ